MKIDNIKVTLSSEYSGNQDIYNREILYFLNLSIPLPGGEANYKFQISKSQYDSLEFASELSKRK